ncbi:MAG: hypothetical protein V4638_04845 [Bacteroidota bacterium]
MKDIFESSVVAEIKERINNLSPETKPQWGKMNAPKMLAHCNVTYDMAFEPHRFKANAFKKFLLKKFVKPYVVTDKPYKKSSPTSPDFLIRTDKNFDTEKQRLFDYLDKVASLGKNHFEGKESASFGALSADEWNVMFYKHLDWHLTQFGA